MNKTKTTTSDVSDDEMDEVVFDTSVKFALDMLDLARKRGIPTSFIPLAGVLLAGMAMEKCTPPNGMNGARNALVSVLDSMVLTSKFRNVLRDRVKAAASH
jgi:hypothetical protein